MTVNAMVKIVRFGAPKVDGIDLLFHVKHKKR